MSFQLPPVELSFRDRKTHLWRRHDRKSSHHTIWEFLTNLGDEERSHTSTSTTTKRVSDLETLKHVTPFGLLTDDVKDRVYELSTCGKKVQERDCMRLCVKTLKAECCSTFLRTASPSLPPTQKCDLSAFPPSPPTLPQPALPNILPQSECSISYSSKFNPAQLVVEGVVAVAQLG